MATIAHMIDALPESVGMVRLRRKEPLFLTKPPSTPFMAWLDHPLLTVAHMADKWSPAEFAPPRDVAAGDHLRLEWQQMDQRQPFFHRNADVDEIAYQIDGERTLMTELGTLELRPGDFSRIPVSIAHDNYGRKDVHLIFYVLGPVSDTGNMVSTAKVGIPPFPGWVADANKTEVLTECMAAVHCDLAVSLVDETLLLQGGLEQTTVENAQLVSQRSSGAGAEPEWLYKSPKVYIGSVVLGVDAGLTYRTHRRATAVHYQTSGSRTLVTQRGTVKLQPGDVTCIPMGCAYTSICSEENSYIVVLTVGETLLKAEVAKVAEPTSPEAVDALRQALGAS